MIKRKDGSYSKRGLWDNIRANKGSGKKPTAEMLKQERKIKNKNEMGGKRKLMKKGGAKPDYLDKDGDGNKKESMKSAIKSKKKMRMGGMGPGTKIKGTGTLTNTDSKGKSTGATKAIKKKMYGGKKKMMGGGMKKMMYKSGGFLEPKIPNIDDL